MIFLYLCFILILNMLRSTRIIGFLNAISIFISPTSKLTYQSYFTQNSIQTGIHSNYQLFIYNLYQSQPHYY